MIYQEQRILPGSTSRNDESVLAAKHDKSPTGSCSFNNNSHSAKDQIEDQGSLDTRVCYTDTVNMAQLPKQWWDIVLDGGIYRIDLRATPYLNITSLRSVVYREAENRLTNVATHKAAPGTLLVQAWGTGGRLNTTPSLVGAAAQAAPTIDAYQAPPRTHECDCDQGPINHPLTCAIWGSNRLQVQLPGRKGPQEVRVQQVTQQQPFAAGECTCAANGLDHLPWCTAINPDGQVPGV